MTLRGLDFDDLLLLKYLGQGQTLTESSRSLNLTQPAITTRVHKIEAAISKNIMDRTTRNRFLTPVGLLVCKIATEAIEVLNRIATDV